jgi:predicted DCC family thiol-disulfide oxidoreductase YuxK
MTENNTHTELTVFYDGSCPICRREIGYYQGRDGASKIDWVDITQSDADMVCEGLSRDDAMARFSVRAGDGSVIRGAGGFIELWKTLPAFSLLGRVLSIPPLTWLLDRVYDLLLVVRPRLQKLFRS